MSKIRSADARRGARNRARSFGNRVGATHPPRPIPPAAARVCNSRRRPTEELAIITSRNLRQCARGVTLKDSSQNKSRDCPDSPQSDARGQPSATTDEASCFQRVIARPSRTENAYDQGLGITVSMGGPRLNEAQGAASTAESRSLSAERLLGVTLMRQKSALLRMHTPCASGTHLFMSNISTAKTNAKKTGQSMLP